SRSKISVVLAALRENHPDGRLEVGVGNRCEDVLPPAGDPSPAGGLLGEQTEGAVFELHDYVGELSFRVGPAPEEFRRPGSVLASKGVPFETDHLPVDLPQEVGDRSGL